MRLICPNCEAQYEVPEDIVPVEGREVQCSACGETWFQDHPNAPQDLELETDDDFVELPQSPQPGPVKEDLPADESVFGQEEAGGTTAPQEPSPPVRRALDPAVEDVLRAEAELEAKARKAERTSLESQPDLGLSDTPQKVKKPASSPEQQTKRTKNRSGKEDLQFAKAASAAMPARRELLPDIEEINSTLRSNNDRSPATDPGQTAQVEVQEKRSSRRGFVITAALVATLTLIYVFAPQIAERVPEAEPALKRYIETVDTLRVWLDAQFTALLGWLEQISAADGA